MLGISYKNVYSIIQKHLQYQKLVRDVCYDRSHSLTKNNVTISCYNILQQYAEKDNKFLCCIFIGEKLRSHFFTPATKLSNIKCLHTRDLSHKAKTQSQTSAGKMKATVFFTGKVLFTLNS